MIVTSQEDLRIDLAEYTSHEALHTLMLDNGFAVRHIVDTLFNRNASCIPWRDMGECLKNPEYMHANCEFACSMLRDRDSNCIEWCIERREEKGANHIFFEKSVCTTAEDADGTKY